MLFKGSSRQGQKQPVMNYSEAFCFYLLSVKLPLRRSLDVVVIYVFYAQISFLFNRIKECLPQ